MSPRRGISRRVSAVLALIFFATFIIGGAAVSESSFVESSLINTVTVVAFVGAMLTIAFAMIGDPNRS